MARNAFRRRSIAKAKPKYAWTNLILTNQAATTGAGSSNIVEPADWERSATSFERATLVGIRGWIAVTRLVNTSASLFMYVGLYDEDEASSLADIVATYDSEEILWTGGTGNSASITNDPPMMINIRAKRKITSASEVRFVRTASANSIYSISCILRGLVQYA